MKTIGMISANYLSDKFGTLTKHRTLASVPFGGRYRLLDFALSNMVNSGITKVGVITPYNSGSVIDHIGSGKQWSLDRKKDGLFIMPGTVYGVHNSGSRFLFRDIIENKAFFERSDADNVLFSGSTDVYNMDYSALIDAHNKSSNQITVLYKKVPDGQNYSGFFLDVDDNGYVTSIKTDASGSSNYFMDCFIVNKSFIEDFVKWFAPLEYKDLFSIIMDNMDKFSIGTYEFTGYFGKISSIRDYMKVSRDLFSHDIRNELFSKDRTIFTKVQDDAPVLYRKNCNIKNSIIAAGCTVNGTVSDSIIFRSTKIGDSAQIKNSVVMMYCDIGEGAVLENVICDKYVKIRAGVKLSGSEDAPIVVPKGSVL